MYDAQVHTRARGTLSQTNASQHQHRSLLHSPSSCSTAIVNASQAVANMNSTERTTRSRPSAGNRKQPGPFRRLLTCCIAGTANREDLDDAYEPDAQSTPPARVEASNAASEPKVLTNSTETNSSDPRGSAAPAGQQALLSSTTVQQLQTGTGQHKAPDAAPSEPQFYQHRLAVANSGDAAGHKGRPVSHTVQSCSDIYAVRTDQQQQYPAAPADAAATDGTPVPVLSQVGPVSALSLESPWDGPNAPAAHLQHHQPGTLLQHQQQQQQQEPFAADATAGFMQGPHGPHALRQHPADLPAMQYRHPFLLDPIAESPRLPGGSPMAGQARPPGGSPREPQVSLAQGLADSDIHLLPEPAAATAAATQGDAAPVLAGDGTVGGSSAEAAAAAAAMDASASNRVESPRQPQVSLAHGLADSDIQLQPESAAATAAAGTLDLQPPAAPAAADGQSADNDGHSTARAAVAAEPAVAAATQPRLVSPAAVSAVAGDSSGLTPPASPRSALATPFTQSKVQALVAHELLVHTRAKKAPSSTSSSSQPGSQQQQQQQLGVTQGGDGMGSSAAAGASAAAASASGSSSGQPGTLPSQQQQQQQQQVERKMQRRPLSEEVEEAVVTQIRPARSTSLTTGADPSRVWALVAQFDGSKQHAAHTPAIPANVAVTVTVPAAGGGAGAAITAGTHMRRSADAASPAAAAAAAAFGGNSGLGTDKTAAMGSGAAGTSPQRLQSPGSAAVQPPSAEEIYAAFSTKSSGGSPARRLSPTTSAAARAEGNISMGSPRGIHLATTQRMQQQQQQQQSPPTSPHSTGWSEDDAGDVPLGLKKIKVGKGKAPKAEAAYSESHSSSNLSSGSSASSAAAKLQSPGAQQHAAGAAAGDYQQQQLGGGLASATGADSFIPHFTAVTGPGSSSRHRSPSPGSGVQGSRAAGLPPRPRSSKDLAGLAGGVGSAGNSGSNSGGWATGVSSSANNSGSKYYSAPGLHIRTGVTGAGTAAPGTAAAGQLSGNQPDNDFNGLQLGGADSLGPFVRTQQQQQVIGGDSSSEGEGEGGGGVSSTDWEVLPVMPLSPLRVPRNKVEDLSQFEDTPPTPRTSVVGVSNSIIDHMLSEEGIPLVPTSGVDEYAGVHGLDSPFFSGPAIFGRSVSGSRAQGLAGVSSWAGGGVTTPRFSHSSSFSAYGMGSNRGLAGGRASYSGPSSAGVAAGAGGRQLPASARGRGRVRRLSIGNEDLNDAATSSWQQFQQQRGISSFDVPTGKARMGRLSDASSSAPGAAAAAAAGSAAIGDRVGGGGDEAPVMTPRGSYGSTTATSFFSSDSKPDQGLEGPMAIVPSQQQVVPVLPISSTALPVSSTALPVHSSTHVSPSAARSSMLLNTPAAASMAAAGAAGGVGPSPSDTASVRSPVSSPISQLAERASAVAAAVAAAAAAGASGDIAAGSSKLVTSVTSDSNNSFNSGSRNSSAAFATSASNLPSDAALFSRSGWATLHPHQQQQQQQLLGQWSLSRRDAAREHGPASLFETPKEPRPRAEATAVLPSLATALDKQ